MDTSTAAQVLLNTEYLVTIGIIICALQIIDFIRRLIQPGRNI